MQRSRPGDILITDHSGTHMPEMIKQKPLSLKPPESKDGTHD